MISPLQTNDYSPDSSDTYHERLFCKWAGQPTPASARITNILYDDRGCELSPQNEPRGAGLADLAGGFCGMRSLQAEYGPQSGLMARAFFPPAAATGVGGLSCAFGVLMELGRSVQSATNTGSSAFIRRSSRVSLSSALNRSRSALLGPARRPWSRSPDLPRAPRFRYG